MSYPGVARIIEKIKRAASADKFPKSGRPRKLNKLARDFIESKMPKTTKQPATRFKRSFPNAAYKFIPPGRGDRVKSKGGLFKTPSTANWSAT